MLSGILVTVGLSVGSTQAQSGNAQNAEAARAGIERLGVGKSARTEITLRDQRKLKGYVGSTGTESFTLVDKKTGASQTIAYADVVNVKKAHSGLKPSTWIIIAGAAAAVIVAIAVKGAFCDGC
jgi:hypothetical protein